MFRKLIVTLLILTSCSRAAERDGPPSAEPDPSGGDEVALSQSTLDQLAATATASTLAAAAALDAEDVVIIDDAESDGSVLVSEQTIVYADADASSAALGLLAARTRVTERGRKKGPGCSREWLEIAPRGFVCAATHADKRPATDAILPRVPRGARVPGAYGKVRDGAVVYSSLADATAGIGGHAPDRNLTVRRLRSLRADGRSFWKTRAGIIEAKYIGRYRGSGFAGAELSDGLALPVAWTLSGADRRTVPVLETASASASVLRRVEPRTRFAVVEGSEDADFVQLRDGGFMARTDLRVATVSTAPAGFQPGERWLDINLDEQTLVAYEGETAVYATLISSGRALHRTPTGVFRINRKVAERTMNSMSDSDELYSVASVPWTAYFAKGYALHAAYWHGGFGRARSHGCVNLSPTDAKRLYAWTAPAVAPGWFEVYGHVAQPGTLVRLRDKRHPEPKLKGYAVDLASPTTSPPTSTG